MKRQVVINLSENSIKVNKTEDSFNAEKDDLSFESSLLCGYGVIGINRLKVSSNKNSSKVGGHFAHYLKSNGYDNILIKGISPTPVYIYIDKSTIEIKDASEFYFSNLKETRKIIKNKLNKSDIEIACIGQAGIKKVDFSRIMFNEDKSCGKNGLGKLMGEKNLKAVVLKQVNIEASSNNIIKEVNKLMCSNLGIDNMESLFSEKNLCYGCNINCKSTSIKKLISKGYNEEYIIKLDYLCNEYGMDTFVFADIIDDRISLEENIQKVLNKEYINIKEDRNKKKGNKLDEVGFCKFLINKNIINEEKIDKLIKDLNLK